MVDFAMKYHRKEKFRPKLFLHDRQK